MIESRKTRALRELDEKLEKMTSSYRFGRVCAWILLFSPVILGIFDIHVFDVFTKQPIEVTVMLFFMPIVFAGLTIEKQMLDILRLIQKINHEEDT